MYLNRPWFERLPLDLQELLLAAGQTVSAAQRLAAAARDDELRRQLEAEGAEVAELSAAELAEFRARVRPVYDELAARLGPGVIEEVAGA
jgi:TRAP-type C4-dicarboxylate transport system substrate-binding protein